MGNYPGMHRVTNENSLGLNLYQTNFEQFQLILLVTCLKYNKVDLAHHFEDCTIMVTLGAEMSSITSKKIVI